VGSRAGLEVVMRKISSPYRDSNPRLSRREDVMIKIHAIKMYWGVEVELHAFLTLVRSCENVKMFCTNIPKL
jgi:hypothetical protein